MNAIAVKWIFAAAAVVVVVVVRLFVVVVGVGVLSFVFKEKSVSTFWPKAELMIYFSNERVKTKQSYYTLGGGGGVYK